VKNQRPLLRIADNNIITVRNRAIPHVPHHNANLFDEGARRKSFDIVDEDGDPATMMYSGANTL
jgi:hypothetical protein